MSKKSKIVKRKDIKIEDPKARDQVIIDKAIALTNETLLHHQWNRNRQCDIIYDHLFKDIDTRFDVVLNVVIKDATLSGWKAYTKGLCSIMFEC